MKPKSQYRSLNDRDGSEVYRGTSEHDAARAARKAAEISAKLGKPSYARVAA